MERGYWEDPNLTPKQRRDNWWRYHWLHVPVSYTHLTLPTTTRV